MNVLKLLLFSGLLLSLLWVAIWFVVTQPFVKVQPIASDVAVSIEMLKTHVRMLSESLPPRSEDTDNLDRTAEYIKTEFARSGQAYEIEYQAWGIPYRNIAVRFGPLTKQRIVIGAHYDSYQGLPGADDNASGIAALIELARLLQNSDLNCSVELVAYTLEEPPYFRTDYMGSAVHARKLREEEVDVVLMLSLEMIGYFSDKAGSQHYPVGLLDAFYTDTGNFVAVVGNLSNISAARNVKRIMRGSSDVPVYSVNAPAIIPGVDFSDHINFWQRGYPAVMITDTALYRNPNYHTERDTWDTLDYARMAEVVKGIYHVILAYAGE